MNIRYIMSTFRYDMVHLYRIMLKGRYTMSVAGYLGKKMAIILLLRVFASFCRFLPVITGKNHRPGENRFLPAKTQPWFEAVGGNVDAYVGTCSHLVAPTCIHCSYH